MNGYARQTTRWTAVFFLLLAMSAVQSRSALARTTGVAEETSQQMQKPAAAPALPELSPETIADLMVAHHRYLAAVAAYQKISPATERIYDKMGIAYEHMFMDADAKASFEHALQINPKFAPVYNNLGTIYYHERNYKKAERYYKKSIHLDDKQASFFGNLGTLYVARRKVHDAAEAYQRAFMLNPGVFQEIAENGIEESDSVQDLQAMNYCFAQIYAQAGRSDLAILYLQKAISQGFHDKSRLDRDQQFAGLRQMPEFQSLLIDQGREGK